MLGQGTSSVTLQLSVTKCLLHYTRSVRARGSPPRGCLSLADVLHPSSSSDKKNIQLLLLQCSKLKQEMWTLINAITLDLNALEMEREKTTVSNTLQLGEGFATQVNSLLNITHTYIEVLGPFLGFSLLPTWSTFCSAGCTQAATGAVVVEQTWLQNLCPFPAATVAWSLHPSSCQPAAYQPQHAPSWCFLSLSLGHCSLSRFGNQSAWRNLPFSLVTFPYSTDIFPLIWKTGEVGDLLGGFACWVKVPLLQATSCVLNRERQGGRKSHC